MTVSTSLRRVAYQGDGASTIFPVPFPFPAAADLKLVRVSAGVETALTLNVHYTVSGAGDPSGGAVTLQTALPAGSVLSVKRVVMRTQETDYVPNDPFPAEAQEDALDKLTMITQEDGDELGRALMVPETDPQRGAMLLPGAADRAGRLLAFDLDGRPIVVDASEGGGPTGPLFNSKSIFLYQRTPTDTPPPLPTLNVRYDFLSGALTGMDNGWEAALPAAGGSFRWMVSATATSLSPVDVIEPDEWSEPAILSQDGIDGLNRATVNAYQRAPTPPAKPTVVATYTFATGLLTELDNGWQQPYPEADGQPLWVMQATAISGAPTDAIAGNEWSDPVLLVKDGLDGTDGTPGADGTIREFIWLRAAAKPDDPTGNGIPAGWYDQPPVGTLPLWMSTARQYMDGTLIGAWSEPIRHDGPPGVNGVNSTSLFLFRRTPTFDDPAGPDGDLVYDFASATLSGGGFNGWAVSMPAAGGDYGWMISATASSTTGSDTIAASEWSAPSRITAGGGVDGMNSAVVTLYARGASAPALPDAAATYTFATGVLTWVSGGWTQALPPTNGQPLWAIQATAVSAGLTDSIAPNEWAGAVKMLEDGAKGDPGDPGPPGADGEDALTISVQPGAILILCNSAWVPNAGELPQSVQLTVFSGGADVTAGTAYSTGGSGVVGLVDNGGGNFSFTGVTVVSGYLDITAAYAGKTGKVRVPVKKTREGASANRAVDTSIGLNDDASYSGLAEGGPLVLAVGPGGISLSAHFEFTSSSTAVRMAGKFQYRTTPGSGAWTDVGSEFDAEQNAVAGEPSYVDAFASLSGPGSPNNWEFRFCTRRSAGAAGRVLPSGPGDIFEVMQA